MKQTQRSTVIHCFILLIGIPLSQGFITAYSSGIGHTGPTLRRRLGSRAPYPCGRPLHAATCNPFAPVSRNGHISNRKHPTRRLPPYIGIVCRRHHWSRSFLFYFPASNVQADGKLSQGLSMFHSVGKQRGFPLRERTGRGAPPDTPISACAVWFDKNMSRQFQDDSLTLSSIQYTLV